MPIVVNNGNRVIRAFETNFVPGVEVDVTKAIATFVLDLPNFEEVKKKKELDKGGKQAFPLADSNSEANAEPEAGEK